MIRQRLILLCVLLQSIFITKISAQNLVPNPSFEDAYTCPDSFTKETVKDLVPGWFVPSRGTPDYFNECNKEDVGIPKNFTGSMEAKDGTAYVGLILKESYNPKESKYVPNKDEYSREYISAKLISPLKHNKLYCISFYYSFAKFSDYAVDGLGVYFSKEKIKQRNDGIIPAKAYIYNKSGRLLKNKKKWEEFCGVIQPKGGEKFITIGNFNPTKEVLYQKIDSAGNEFMSKYAYYIIDKVKVFAIENEFECGCSGNGTEVNKSYLASNLNSDKNNSYLADKNKNLKNKNSDSNKYADKNDNNKTKNTQNDSNKNGENNDKNTIINANNSNKNKNASSENNSSTDKNIQGMDNINEIENGLSVTLKNIFFALEESKLSEASFTELDKLVFMMNENPDMKIEIYGHSDNTGSDEFNMKLSKERAKAVADYLRSNDIRKKRISWKGFGNTMPVTNNDTEENRAKNRRVEFKIVKK